MANEFGGRSETRALLRVLDANLDRAREGLRVVEEWCRLGLEDADRAESCKQMRHELAAWHRSHVRAARDADSDPGTELSHAREERRQNLQEVLQANFCRVQEALRVLEEYGKLYDATSYGSDLDSANFDGKASNGTDLGDTSLSDTCKRMRYRVYALETQLLARERFDRLHRASLYLITSPGDRLFETVKASLEAGLLLVQYRDKNASDGEKYDRARHLCELCHRYGALFLVNDSVDIALAVGADGVHLGQQDLPVPVARKLLGFQKIVGCSTTDPAEMKRALEGGADYLGVGPVYETPTKPGKAAAGFDYVRYAAQHAGVPWFAIGGIDAENVGEVVAAGADRVAIVRAIAQAESPAIATQSLLDRIHYARQQRMSQGIS